MIWDVLGENSEFDNKFNKEDLTIQELLLDENILTQLQNLNSKLISFLQNNSQSVLSKLVHYVITLPTQIDSQQRTYNLPYMSSQMLAVNNPIFYNAFFNQGPTPLFAQLMSFLNSEGVQNQVLLGYFRKVTRNLYKGKKKEFIKAIHEQLPNIERNLGKQSIGAIINDCVILFDCEDGVLEDQRKAMTQMLITTVTIKEDNACSREKRIVSANILVQILGKHKSFSSGDAILQLILNSPQILQIYTMYEFTEINKFLYGILNKSNMKIYDPELEDYIKIFKIPLMHESHLSNYISKQLQQCMSKQQEKETITQQDKQVIRRVSKEVLNLFSLISEALTNGLNGLLSENLLKFGLEYMKKHSRCDILLVHVDKILNSSVDNKQNKELYIATIIKFICKLEQDKEKELRSHLFLIWSKINKLLHSSQAQTLIYPPNWNQINSRYLQIQNIHKQAPSVDPHTRPQTKLIVDEEEGLTMINQQCSAKYDNKQDKDKQKKEQEEKQEKNKNQWENQRKQKDYSMEFEGFEQKKNEKVNQNFGDFSAFDF